MKELVIARLIKGGFNKADVIEMVAKYWSLAESRGCETVKEFADDISGFWSVG